MLRPVRRDILVYGVKGMPCTSKINFGVILDKKHFVPFTP